MRWVGSLLGRFSASGYSSSSMALLKRVSRMGAMNSLRSWRMAGLILKMSFVLLRSIFFSVSVMISVVVWRSWNGGWLVGGLVGRGWFLWDCLAGFVSYCDEPVVQCVCDAGGVVVLFSFVDDRCG